MKVLYIGQYTNGSTSKMRGEQIKKILNPKIFEIVDVSQPFFKTPRIFRSLGFRYKKGPLISNINNYVLDHLQQSYDLIWIDKAVFILPETTNILKNLTKYLIHYTPDMAFYENYSKYFIQSLPEYDYIISTKTQEINLYYKYIHPKKLIITTQGCDLNIHKTIHNFNEKENSVAFIGLAESHRFMIIEKLIKSNIYVKLAGKGWNQFIKKNAKNKYLQYYGNGLFAQSYTDFISSSLFGIGLLSKRFPEKHTTRTFEIPACGTALLTEKNEEIASFYQDDEVIFYENSDNLIEKINYHQSHLDELEQLTKKGTLKVNEAGFDYESILRKLLNTILSE